MLFHRVVGRSALTRYTFLPDTISMRRFGRIYWVDCFMGYLTERLRNWHRFLNCIKNFSIAPNYWIHCDPAEIAECFACSDLWFDLKGCGFRTVLNQWWIHSEVWIRVQNSILFPRHWNILGTRLYRLTANATWKLRWTIGVSLSLLSVCVFVYDYVFSLYYLPRHLSLTDSFSYSASLRLVCSFLI